MKRPSTSVRRWYEKTSRNQNEAITYQINDREIWSLNVGRIAV